jgi:hypothetical protein
MGPVSASQDRQGNMGVEDTGIRSQVTQNKEEGFNWKLPLFGAIGFGISFALMNAIMLTIYNIAKNRVADVFPGTGVAPGESIFIGIIVGAIGGGAMGLAFKDKMLAFHFSLTGAMGFAIAFSVAISLIPSAVSDLGEAIIRLMGGSGYLSSFEFSLARGLGAGAIIGSIGGLGLGLASPKGRIASSLLLCFTGALWFANAFAFGSAIYEGDFHSSWNAWGGAIGGAIFGLTLALFYKIYDKAQLVDTSPTEAVVPARTTSPAGTKPLISAAVNQVGFLSALLTTASAVFLSIGFLALLSYHPQQVVPPGTASLLGTLAAGLLLLEAFGFVVLMACIAKSAPPATIAWHWLGLIFAVLAAGCICLQISPLTRSGLDFRILIFPSRAQPDEFIFWNAVFTSLACLCVLPVFLAGRIERFIRLGLLIYAGTVLLTSIVALFGDHSGLLLIKMFVQLVVFPLTIGSIAVIFGRAKKMPPRSENS